ncbi:hypothetical protein [Nocardia sp. XZ_19_385]|uniref:hypothetical protein n=1 Tax=Nocardia sp. XZ_19_385 TaxID=2769488 RepID=UPI001890AFA1|nr:hypothetical protein [Nocardia sp. XZ_19_385]
MTINEEKTRWSHLASEAKAGRLYLDQAVAKDCRDACNKQIALYEGLIDDLEFMKRVSGFGNFECADKLAEMLGQKAFGGDGDVYTALKEHISVIELIRDTIQVSVDKYEAQDKVNAGEQDKLLN